MKKFQLKQLENKKSGFTQVPNSFVELLTGEFGLSDAGYICYLAIFMSFTQFNPNNGNFGTFNATNLEIAEFLSWSASKTSRVLGELKSKAIIVENEDGLKELVGFRALHLLTSGFSKARNKLSPNRKYIPTEDVIRYCIKKGESFQNAKTIADLQDFELELYMDSIDIATSEGGEVLC